MHLPFLWPASLHLPFSFFVLRRKSTR
jgi:hypothetical protein